MGLSLFAVDFNKSEWEMHNNKEGDTSFWYSDIFEGVVDVRIINYASVAP